MKTLATIIICSSLFINFTVMAGAKPDHTRHSRMQLPVNKVVAEENAGEVIASLVERDKIDKSWLSIKASSVEKKRVKGTTEWVVTFYNKAVPAQDKQRLYVFLTLAGKYVAVSYSEN